MKNREEDFFYREAVRKEIIKNLKSKKWINRGQCLRDKQYMECVYDILSSRPFKQMDQYIQHGSTTTMEHCLSVSYVSYNICRRFSLDYRSAARGGLLHDLFLYDWHTHCQETGERFHGLTHPRAALKNANKYFDLNRVEQDIILKHMWPLTVVPPKTMEGFVVMYADKYCRLIESMEIVRRAVPNIAKYVKIP